MKELTFLIAFDNILSVFVHINIWFLNRAAAGRIISRDGKAQFRAIA